MIVRNEIKNIVNDALGNLKKSGIFVSQDLPDAQIDYTSNEKFGDYSTNIALGLSKGEKKSPKELAEIIVAEILKNKKTEEMFERVDIAGAGFINFTLSNGFLQNRLNKYSGNESQYENSGKGEKVNIEFLSANPTGKFQVGNARGGFYGDVLGNVLRFAGYEVDKEYYLNNAKTSNQIIELGKTALGQGEKYLTDYVKSKIDAIKSELDNLSGSDPDKFGEAGYLLAGEINKDNKEFLEEIGIKYDIWTEEEKLHNDGKLDQALKILEEKGLVYEEEGARWLKTTQFGDDKDKVVVRSNGEYGYYLADIAYHLDKIQRGYKVIIDVFGADHQGHVAPMKIAMEILGFEGKFEVVVTQLVQAKGGGRFSKRAGNVILLEELIEEVGVDVARFFYLMRSVDTQMEFDMDLAKDQSDKNPVYYVQYAHARMAGILRKAQEDAPELENGEATKILHKSELKLIKCLIKWQEVIEDTAKDYQIQRITSYASELATVFNGFYRDCKVIEDGKLIKSRLAMVISIKALLRDVLGVLGIKAPDKM